MPRQHAPHRQAATAALAAALGLCSAWAPQAQADDRKPDSQRGHDHDRARAAVQSGQVLPLNQLLARLARSHPGTLLEAELEREDGRWVYELKLLQSDGTLLRLDVDAQTGAVLRSRQRGPAPPPSKKATP